MRNAFEREKKKIRVDLYAYFFGYLRCEFYTGAFTVVK